MTDVADTLRKISVLPEPVRLALLAVEGPGWLGSGQDRYVELRSYFNRANLYALRVPVYGGSNHRPFYIDESWAWLPCSEVAIVQAAMVHKGASVWSLNGDRNGPSWASMGFTYSGDIECEGATPMDAALALFCAAHGVEWKS